MLTAQQALDHLLSNAMTVTESEKVSTQAALGRVLADDVKSLVDVPPLDNTSMDGYAVRCADTATPGQTLKIAQRIPAGSIGTQLESGTAARIFTGAPVPPGADAVVMQEDCTVGDQPDQGRLAAWTDELGDHHLRGVDGFKGAGEPDLAAGVYGVCSGRSPGFPRAGGENCRRNGYSESTHSSSTRPASLN